MKYATSAIKNGLNDSMEELNCEWRQLIAMKLPSFIVVEIFII